MKKIIISFSLLSLIFLSCSKEESSLQVKENTKLVETYIYKGKTYTCNYSVINDSTYKDYSVNDSATNSFIAKIMEKPESGIVSLPNKSEKYLFDNDAEATAFLKTIGNNVAKSSLKSAPVGSQIVCYKDANLIYQMFDCLYPSNYPQPHYYDMEQSYGYESFGMFSVDWNDKLTSIYIKNTDPSKYLVVRVCEHTVYGGHYIIFVISYNSNSLAGVVNYDPNGNQSTADYRYTSVAQTKNLSLRRLRDGVSWNDKASSIKWWWINPGQTWY